MVFVADLLNTWVPSLKWIGFKNSVDKFAEIMVTQLDLTHEAANMARFRKDFAAE